MTSAMHRAAKRGKLGRLRRRHPVAFGLGLVAGFVGLGAGVAWALFTLVAPVTGSVSSNTAVAYFSNPTATSPNADATCSVATTGTAVSPGGSLGSVYPGLSITMKNAYPGSSCTFSAPITAASSTEDQNVKGVTLSGLPTGWTATLDPASCGLVAPHSNLLSATPVKFTVTMGATAAAGSGGAISASGSGIQLVPASQWVAPNNTCS